MNSKHNVLTNGLTRFWHDEEAATAAEYGIIAALIAVAIIAAVTSLGTSLKGMFNRLATYVSKT